MGIMLYWAEGSKQKESNISQGLIFSNSDPKMVQIFLKWLIECLEIPLSNINFDIYLHSDCENRAKEISGYWSKISSFPISKFGKIYYKKHKLKSNRKNKGLNYFGLIRIKVSRSTDLNRKINGWIEGIYKQCGVV